MKSNLLFKTIFRVLLVLLLSCCIFALSSCLNDITQSRPNDEKLEYSINADGNTCTVTGLGTYSSKNLIIPENIDGYTVTAIAEYAFQGTDIETFSGADTITTIGKYAFQNCKQLQTVIIPTGVTKIGEHCFEYCENLSGVDLSLNLKTIEKGTFANCFNLKTVNLPVGIVEIGENAFYLCQSMTEINIPNTLKTIRKCAFIGCSSLSNIIIPNSVTTIDTGAFTMCVSFTNIYIPASVVLVGESIITYNNLTTIDVDIENPVLSSIDGNLYCNNGTVFMNYACAKTESTFSLPNGVNVIQSFSFSACPNLKSISVPNTVNSIGSLIFSRSSNIETIYYDGTVMEWTKIEKKDNWNGDTESVFTIICTDGTIAMDGTVTYN